jgi:NADH-quinone oxidoreductase subunit J
VDNVLFVISALFTVCGAIAVVFVKDIMHACMFLLLTLMGVAGLYLTLGADFVAATQLAVYVGGVVILMVFAVMLTGGTKNQTANKFGMIKIPSMGNVKTYVIGGITAIMTFFIIFRILGKVLSNAASSATTALPYTETVERIGVALVTDHVLAFEISSVLLLGALVGAAIIARPRKGN